MRRITLFLGALAALSLTSFWMVRPNEGSYKIAYISESSRGRNIQVMNFDASAYRGFESPSLSGRYFNGTSSTPDGKRLAFMRDVEGIDRYSLWTLLWNGSGLKRLTPVGKEALYPAWSTNGSQLSFTRRVGGVWEIFAINSDGTGERQLSKFRSEGKRPSWGARTSWSPDGKYIAFSVSFGRSAGYEIYLMNLETGEYEALTGDDYDGRVPSFSPDGKLLAFNSTATGKWETVVMDMTTRQIRRLGNQASAFGLSWSPDGTHILYAGRKNNNTDIYIMDADGKNQRRLTTSSGLDIAPCWIYAE